MPSSYSSFSFASNEKRSGLPLPGRGEGRRSRPDGKPRAGDRLVTGNSRPSCRPLNSPRGDTSGQARVPDDAASSSRQSGPATGHHATAVSSGTPYGMSVIGV